MSRRLSVFVVLTVMLVLAAACSASDPDSEAGAPAAPVGLAGRVAGTPEPQPTLPTRAQDALTGVGVQVTPVTPVVTPAQPDVVTINVWWPDEVFPAEGSPARAILLNQFESFQLTNATYTLNVRQKRTNGLGGILPTLRTAGPVAPAALPDLTLMRRSDMLAAANEGLIVPITDWVPASLVGSNLFPGALDLGTIDGELYGVPYLLNVYHTVYRATVFEEPLVTFADVLAADPVYLFPGSNSATSAANLTVLLQYLAAGGQLTDVEGNPALDHDPLVAVLTYYEQGIARGIFTPDVLDYTVADDYWATFGNADANLIGVDARTYLQHKDTVPNTGLAPIPTLDGTPNTVIEGWMWVLTTQDPDHQNLARIFLDWMMDVSEQSLFTEAQGVLPSQQRALRLWNDETYADFIQSLILTGEVIPFTLRTGSAAVALQEAFTAVVMDGLSAEVAADLALARLTPPEG